MSPPVTLSDFYGFLKTSAGPIYPSTVRCVEVLLLRSSLLRRIRWPRKIGKATERRHGPVVKSDSEADLLIESR